MPKIKITGTPEMQMSGNTKRVRITGTPDMNNNTVMANGGYAKNSSNFEAGKHYDLNPQYVQELINQGYDITIL